VDTLRRPNHQAAVDAGVFQEAIVSKAEEYKPPARKEGLLIEALDKELLIYDAREHRAHCLNQTAAMVWRLCDGHRSESEIALRLGRELQQEIRDEVVCLAVDQLRKSNLVENDTHPHEKLTRRKVVARLGFAALAAVPVVTTLLAPTALANTSCIPTGQPCRTEDGIDCCNKAGCSSAPPLEFGVCN
jgi:hypothetical protein